MTIDKLAKGVLKIGLFCMGLYVGVRFADEIKHSTYSFVQRTIPKTHHDDPRLENARAITEYIYGVYNYDGKK